MRIGKTSIIDWGLFAFENIPKDDLIGEYVGRILTNHQLKQMNVKDLDYTFTLYKKFTVDSKWMGNILRYANYQTSEKTNAVSKVIFFNDEHHLCLFAKKDIKINEEIVLNYDGKNIMSSFYPCIKTEGKLDKSKKTKKKKSSGEIENYLDKRKNTLTREETETYLNNKRNRPTSSHNDRRNKNISDNDDNENDRDNCSSEESKMGTIYYSF